MCLGVRECLRERERERDTERQRERERELVGVFRECGNKKYHFSRAPTEVPPLPPNPPDIGQTLGSPT